MFCLCQQMSLHFKSLHSTRVNICPSSFHPLIEQRSDHLLRQTQLHLLYVRPLDVDRFCRGRRVLRATFAAATTYYQTKKLLDVSCKYPTTVRVIAYKVIFKWSFKHPHNGFGCLLADHVTPPE